MDSLIFELQIVFYFQLFSSANVRHSFNVLYADASVANSWATKNWSRDTEDHGGQWSKAPPRIHWVTLPPQSSGERGLKSLETEYEITKMKAAVNIYGNTDPTMGLVRQFKEKPA